MAKPLKLSSGKIKEFGSSDLVGSSNLGSGVSSNLTFLRGDQTWAVLNQNTVLSTIALPVLLASDTHNLNVLNLNDYNVIKLYSLTNVDITGIIPPDITKSNWLMVFNTGTKTIKFKKNNSSSSSSNRFLFNNDITVQSDEGIILVYDPLSLRWRSPGKSI